MDDSQGREKRAEKALVVFDDKSTWNTREFLITYLVHEGDQVSAKCHFAFPEYDKNVYLGVISTTIAALTALGNMLQRPKV